MKARLTPEELARAHDGMCGVSIGDGDCSCLVHWVEGLQKDLDAKELQISRLQKALGNIKEELIGIDLAAGAAVIAEEALAIKGICAHDGGVETTAGMSTFWCKKCGQKFEHK